ncbi:hypothetical protein FXO37_13537 [Capsicum annuum]|nr:hypothetical protein FXO37_13537 [Capsicum annuum]
MIEEGVQSLFAGDRFNRIRSKRSSFVIAGLSVLQWRAPDLLRLSLLIFNLITPFFKQTPYFQFHYPALQYDVYGNLFGLLASHLIAPLVTLHHLNVVEPIFPNVTRVQALWHLTVPMKLDLAGLMQQSSHRVSQPAYKWKMTDPTGVDRIQVYKKPDLHLWDSVSSFVN